MLWEYSRCSTEITSKPIDELTSITSMASRLNASTITLVSRCGILYLKATIEGRPYKVKILATDIKCTIAAI